MQSEKTSMSAPVHAVLIPRDCWLRPILVHTINRNGDWSWSIGFRIGDDIAAKADHIMRFDGTQPVRESIEHYDKRCSAHYWFELEEIDRAAKDMANDSQRWCGASIVKTWGETIETLKAWGMVSSGYRRDV